MTSRVSLAPFDRVRALALALLLVAGGVLLGVVYAQVGLGIEPCILCLVQRGPWVAVAVLAALAFQPTLSDLWRRRLLGAIAVVLGVNMVVAGYHVGVEAHWWAGTAACGAGPKPPAATSLSDLRAALAQAKPETPRCDEPGWTLGGISFAGYNFGLCLILAAVSAGVARRTA
ncbi:disulfide bond formation protein B [Pararhodospirillum photometricum]|nr:disulfide bond formation protein B [Pararhodospirillum photometricum]